MRTFIASLVILCCLGCEAQPGSSIRINLNDTGYSFHNRSADGTGKFYYGREIAQVMGSGGSGWLDRNERQQEENTQLAIQQIQVPANGVIADIGAGTGYYSFQLAKKVPRGKVYAVEIQDEFINLLKKKKAALNDRTVEVIKGTDHTPNLPANSVDIALMVDVYHELEFPHEMLQSIRTALKLNGKILLLEYRGEDESIPIKALHKTTVAQLTREMKANGFRLSERREFLPIQHFLLFEKAPQP